MNQQKPEEMSIYNKLHKIQEKVMGLGKDKKGFGYDYVTGSKVLDHIKPLMNELKLLLKQEIISIDNERQDYQTKNGSKSEILSKVQMKFTWIDCESGEKDENLFGANGQNDWDKGVGSALTYAERYFLLKFFHINTDEDDIDNPARKPQEAAQPQPAAQPPKQNIATLPPNELNRISAALANLKDLEGYEALKKKEMPLIKAHPSLKGMFSSKLINLQKLQLNGNA